MAAVGVLFCDQVGSTALLTRLGDALAEELRRDLFAMLAVAVERARGSIVKSSGDGVMAVFEADPADAVVCAELMLRGVARLQARPFTQEVALRVGASYGDAIPDDGDWYGAAVNLAARLCARADAGQLLVNEDLATAAPDGGWAPVGDLDLKGFPTPVPAFARRVSGEAPALPAEFGLDGCVELVGRASPLQVARDALADAIAGARRLLVVLGDAGSGVTRLLGEVATAGAHGGAAVTGATCGEGPVLAQLLRWDAGTLTAEDYRDLAGDMLGAVAAMVPMVAARHPDGGAPGAGSRVDVAEQVLSRRAQAQPLVVVIDSLERCDHGDVDDLVALLGSALPGSTLFAVGARTDDLDHDERLATLLDKLVGLDGSTVVRLEPLGGAEVRHVLADVLDAPDAVIDAAAAAATAATAGNAKALAAIVDGLVAAGLVGRRVHDVEHDAVITAVSGACPFRGLEPFGETDTAVFFGRAATVDDVVGELTAERAAVLIGASGSGKSSLLRAGVIPRLRGAGCSAVTMTPGADPLGALGDARDALDGAPRPRLLAVDQFEECFTLADPSATATFVDEVCALTDGWDAVALVLRGDAYGAAAQHPALAELLRWRAIPIRPMTGDDLRLAVDEPARTARLTVESGLRDALVTDVAATPGSLPLFAHALHETWRRRRGRRLELDAYLAAGRAAGAIARTADRVHATLDDRERELLRRLSLRLVALADDGTALGRRRVQLRELDSTAGEDAARQRVLDALVAARLVTVDDGAVELAHEALLREWPRLRTWIEDHRETLRVLRHLERAAAEWEASGRASHELYRGARLDAAAALDPAELTARERAFLDASRAALDAQLVAERRTSRRLRTLLGATTLLLVAALVAGGVAGIQRAQAREQADLALGRQLATQSAAASASEPDLALLLALEASHRLPDKDRALPLLRALGTHAPLVRHLRSGDLGDPGPRRLAPAVRISADGRHVIALGGDGRVTVITGDRIRAQRIERTDGATLADIAVAPDGSPLVALGRCRCGPDGSEELRSIGLGAQSFRARIPASDAILSPDGRFAVAVTSDVGSTRLRTYRVADGTPAGGELEIEPSLGIVNASFLADGRTLALDGTTLAIPPETPERTFALVDAATGAVRRLTLKLQGLTSGDVAFNADGSRAVYTDGGPVRMYDTVSGSEGTPGDLGRGATALALSPNARYVAAARGDHVTLYDLAQRDTPPQTFTGISDATTVTVSDDGLVTAVGDGAVLRWQQHRTWATRVDVPTGVKSLTSDGTDALVVSAASTGLVDVPAVWRIGTPDGDPVTLPVPRSGRCCAASAVGPGVLAGALLEPPLDAVASPRTPATGRIVVWDSRTGAELRHFGRAGHALAISGDGRLLARADLETVAVYDARTGRAVHGDVQLPTRNRNPDTPMIYEAEVALSSDGTLLAAALDDVTVYRVQPWRQLHSVTGGRVVTFSPDGRRLVIGDGPHTRIVDTRSGSVVLTLRDVPDGGTARYSLDGRLLVTTDPAGVAVRDPATGERLAVLPLPAPARDLTFVTGTDRLAALAGGAVWDFDLTVGTLRTAVCDRAGRDLTGAEIARHLGTADPQGGCRRS